MDVHHFDALTRYLRSIGSRRRVLRLLTAVSIIGGLSARESQVTDAKPKSKCAKAGQPTNRKHRRCCRGLVKGSDGRCVKRGGGYDVCARGCRYATVQAAIGDAKGPSTIHICPGRYKENLGIGKNVTLIGAGQGNNSAVDTILDATGTNASAVGISTDLTVGLRGLRIIGGGGTTTPDGGGIFNGGATLTLTDCTIIGNRAGNGGGIFHLDHTLTLRGCTVTDNTAGHGGGIFNAASLQVEDGATIGPNNHADEMGGGIWNLGTVACSGGSAVSGNSPDDCVDDGPGSGCGACPA